MAANEYKWSGRALRIAVRAAALAAAKAFVLDPNGATSLEKDREMEYLLGVMQSRDDGKVPPFEPNDLVRLRRPQGELGETVCRVVRVWYHEHGTWGLTLDNGRYYYRADKFEKVPTSTVQRVKEPAHA